MARTPIITAIVVLLISSAARAQETADSLEALQRRVENGARVVVKDRAGIEIEGVLTGLTASGISLRVGRELRQWPGDGISELRRNGDSVRNGTLVGLGIGLGAGVAAGLAMASRFANEGANAVGVFINMSLVGAGIGAALGAGFDASRRDQSVLFRRSPLGGGPVSFSPSVTPTVRALYIAVQF